MEGGDAVELGFDVADELMRSVLKGGVAGQFILECGESNVFRRFASTALGTEEQQKMLLSEGPWRKSTFQGTGHPTHHVCFPTLSGRVSSPFPSQATDHRRPALRAIHPPTTSSDSKVTVFCPAPLTTVRWVQTCTLPPTSDVLYVSV